MITIIDYGAGNVKSVQNMLKKIGVKSILTNSITEIENAQPLVSNCVEQIDLLDFLSRKFPQSSAMVPFSRDRDDRAPLAPGYGTIYEFFLPCGQGHDREQLQKILGCEHTFNFSVII